MKRILSLLMLSALLFSLVACGGIVADDPTTELTTDEPTTAADVSTEPSTTEPEVTTES